MILPPLPDPERRSERAIGLAGAIPIAVFLFGSLLLLNLAQTLSLVIRPISSKTFRSFNRFAADTWWGWCVTLSERVWGIRLEVTGDDVPMRENAIVFANHQQMTDIPFLLIYARTKGRLGDLKWFAKDAVKYVPGVGWGMWFLDCIFVKRHWDADQASIEATFEHLVKNHVPAWLVTFPEGTRVTPEKLEKSRDYAAKLGVKPPESVLVPRTKGFVASVKGLRNHVHAVYDITIGYERGLPTIWQYVKGFALKAHMHVRRFSIDELPQDDAGLAAWLLRRFEEKDQLLEHYYRTGAFPTDPAESRRSVETTPPHTGR